MQEVNGTMANLTRFDPSSEVSRLQQAMGRPFEGSLISPLSWRKVVALTRQSGNGAESN